MKYQQVAEIARKMIENTGRVIVGHETQLQLILSAVLAGGHVLLQDVPGTGKTTLAKALARSVDASFARVQFTPDLLPADITGMRIFKPQTGAFEFIQGPVFTNVLLADEINRATPRTQSALLECMEERQVSEGGVTYALPAPFLVIATQNPVETQGTFPLPEAQLDRFLICLTLGYPSTEETMKMLRRFDQASPLNDLQPVAQVSELQEAQQVIRSCSISDDVLRYLITICEAARDPERVRLGPSPRAELMMMRCAQALAAIRGRDYVIPDDIRDLVLPVLGHRVILRGMMGQNVKTFLQEMLGQIPVPTEDRL